MKSSLSIQPKPVHVLFWIALVIYAVTLPIANTMALRNFGLVLLLTVTIYTLVSARVKPEFPLAAPWSAYAAVAFVSLIYAIDFEYSARNFVAEIVIGALVFSLAATWSRGKPILNGLTAILTLLNVASLLTLLALYPFDQLWNIYTVGVASLHPFARVAINSNFLVSVMPLIGLGAWRLRRHGHAYLAAALIVLLGADLGAMLISGNRQNMIAITASMLCVVAFLPRTFLTRRRIAALLALILFIAALFLLQLLRRADGEWESPGLLITMLQQDPRWDLWRFSIEKIVENPWQGGGFGRGVFDRLYSEYRPEDPLLWHAHNMILNKGIQMGIPGMLAFVWLWSALFRKLATCARGTAPSKEISLVGLAIATGVFFKSMSDDFFFRDPALLFWLQMGVLFGEMRRIGDRRQ